MFIYVGNLPYTSTEQELEELFGQYGPVSRANIVTDRDTGRSRGFGFVEMENPTDGQAAIEALNGHEWGGRTLTVNEARPRSNDRRGGGGGGRFRRY